MAVIEQRILKDGTVKYRAKIRVKGHPHESRTFSLKTKALKWSKKREAELEDSRNFRRLEGEKKTLKEAVHRYLIEQNPKRPVADQQKTAMQLQWWESHYGHLVLIDLTPSVLAEAREKLLNSPLSNSSGSDRMKSPATVKRYMASLSHLLTVAVQEWEWLLDNPMHRVKKPTVNNDRVRFLEKHEIESLKAACLKSPCPHLYPVVVFALATGARYSEILNLNWNDIDFNRQAATFHKTKNKERRTVPLADFCLNALIEHKKTQQRLDTNLVFPRKDGKEPMNIRKHWEKALKEASIEDFRFHDLRHTAASYLAMSGASLTDIAHILGHKTLQMVKRYAHLSDTHTQLTVSKMNNVIFGGGNGL